MAPEARPPRPPGDYRPDLRPLYNRHQIYLCRGKDLGNNTYGEPRKILEEYVRHPSTATH